MKTGKSFSVLPKTALHMLTDATSNAGRDGSEQTFFSSRLFRKLSIPNLFSFHDFRAGPHTRGYRFA